MQKYYDILELEFPSTRDEIKKSYYRLAHIHHPDKGGDGEYFKKVSEAYHILVQRGYWDVLAKEQQKGTPMTKEYASSNKVQFDDLGNFWMEDNGGFVTYYWTGVASTYSDWRNFDDSPAVKDYADLSPKLIKKQS